MSTDMSSNMISIGEKMRERRQQLHLSLQDVGDAIGVTKVTVMRWETGSIRNMGRDKILELARVLQMSPNELLGGEPDQDPFIIYDPDKPQMTQQQAALFDAAADLTPKEMAAVMTMIESIKAMRN